MKATVVIIILGIMTGCSSPADESPVEHGELLVKSIQPIQREPSPLELSIKGYDRMHLKGSVKKLEEHFYSATLKSGKITRAPLHVGSLLYQDNRIYFSEEGFLIKRELLNGKDIRHKSQYKYDQKGRLARQIDIMPWDKSLVYEQELFYDDNGALIKRINTYSNMSQSVHLFTYDTLKHRIIERNFTDGILISKKAHVYDTQHNLIEALTFVPPDTDTVLYDIQYKYDNQKNVIEEINDISRITYTLNESGLPIKCEEHQLTTGQLTGIETYTYVLDSTGNWIEKFIFVDGNPFVIAVRTITYY